MAHARGKTGDGSFALKAPPAATGNAENGATAQVGMNMAILIFAQMHTPEITVETYTGLWITILPAGIPPYLKSRSPR